MSSRKKKQVGPPPDLESGLPIVEGGNLDKALRERIAEAVLATPPTLWHTGGGCTCWGLVLQSPDDPEGAEALEVHIGSEGSIPERGEAWGFSVTDSDGHCVGEYDAPCPWVGYVPAAYEYGMQWPDLVSKGLVGSGFPGGDLSWLSTAILSARFGYSDFDGRCEVCGIKCHHDPGCPELLEEWEGREAWSVMFMGEATLRGIRRATDDECREMWGDSCNIEARENRPFMLEFFLKEGGHRWAVVAIMSDPEGNGAGFPAVYRLTPREAEDAE